VSFSDLWNRVVSDRLVKALLIVAEEVKTLRQVIVSLEAKMDAKFQALIDQVKANTDVEASAVALISGLSQRLTDALAKASAAGATDEQLAAVTAETDALKASADALAKAVTANTPSA
jgi:hypothetical protein